MLRRDQPAMTVLLGALIAVAPLAMDIYLASMPSMTGALSTTAEQVQLTLSLYMYGWGVSQLLVGPLTDRFGRRPALIAGLALFVVASVACAASRNIETLIAARIAQAIGMGTVAVVPRAIVRDLYTGEHAARMLSLMGIVLGIAPVVAPIIGSHLHVWFGWRSNFIFVAVYGAIALVCVLAALAWGRVGHPLAIVAPMFLFMVALMTTMPPATAGALSAFPEIAGSAASLLLFCQFVLASTAALIVGVTFDDSQRPMATTIAAATLLTFVAFRVLVRPHRAGRRRDAT